LSIGRSLWISLSSARPAPSSCSILLSEQPGGDVGDADVTTPPAKRSLLRGILHTLATIALGQGAQILTGIVTARVFGPGGKGIISYAGVFVSFAIASVEGIRNAIAFQVGDESLSLRAIWRAALYVLAVAAPLGSLLFLVLWLNDRSQIAFLFVAIVFPFAAFLQTVNILYLVRNAIERINVQNSVTVGAGSSLATLFAVLVFHVSIPVVLWIWVGGFVIASIWALSGVPSLLQPLPHLAVTRPLVREQTIFALKGGASAILTVLALRVDILIIGQRLSKTELGVYVTAVSLGELMWTLSRSVTWATTGRIATEPRAAAIALTAKVVRLLLGVQFLAGAVLFVAGPFAINLLYGPRFEGSGLLLQILLPRFIMYSADGIVSYFISVREGRPGIQLGFEAATLVLCAVATYAAIGPYGLTGAATAATVTFVAAFCAKLAYFVHVTKTPWHDVLVLRANDIPLAARERIARAFGLGR